VAPDKHALDGLWPQGALREQVGLSILNPANEWIVFERGNGTDYEFADMYTQSRQIDWGSVCLLLCVAPIALVEMSLDTIIQKVYGYSR